MSLGRHLCRLGDSYVAARVMNQMMKERAGNGALFYLVKQAADEDNALLDIFLAAQIKQLDG